jgi:hypothetical protein
VTPLEAWRHAESTLGDADAVQASTLPAPLGTVLRAMEALDAGDPAVIADLAAAVEVSDPLVASTLRLLLTSPEATPAAELRALTLSQELPYGDLLDALNVARTGRPAIPTDLLEECAGYRPALHAVFRLLTDDETATYTNPLVQAFSPRADQLQVAARAVQITGHTARSRLQHYFGELAMRLDADRWPELDQHVRSGDLVAWSQRRAPWTTVHDDEVAGLLAAGPAPLQRALGALLHRIGRDTVLGRLSGLARPTRAAFSLAWTLRVDPDLIEALGTLQLRVDRFDPEHTNHSPVVYVQLWRAAKTWPAEDRLLCAKAVLTQARREVLPSELFDAAGLLMARSPSSQEAGDLLLELATRRAPQDVAQILQSHDAPVTRRVHLMGLHAAAAGFHPQALQAVRRLAKEEVADPDAIGQILRTTAGGLARREMWPEDLNTPLAETLETLAVDHIPLSVWGPLAAQPQLARLVTDTAVAQLVGRQDVHSATPVEVAASLVVAFVWGDEAGRRPIVRDLGRRLRSLDDASSADLALRTLGWLYAWNGVNSRQWTRAELRPITAFLHRQQGQPAEHAARSLPPTGPVVAGAVDWFLSTRPAPEVSLAWRLRVRNMLSVPEEAAETFAAVAEEADLAGTDGLASAAARLQEALNARLSIRQELTGQQGPPSPQASP